MTKYIIDKSKPFAGYIQSTITDGLVDYSGLSFEDYKNLEKNAGLQLEIIGDEELNEINAEYRKSLCEGTFKEITQEHYWEMLEVLPPVDYANGRFFISEFYYASVTDQYAQIGGKYYSKRVDYCNRKTWINSEDLKKLEEKRRKAN